MSLSTRLICGKEGASIKDPQDTQFTPVHPINPISVFGRCWSKKWSRMGIRSSNSSFLLLLVSCLLLSPSSSSQQLPPNLNSDSESSGSSGSLWVWPGSVKSPGGGDGGPSSSLSSLGGDEDSEVIEARGSFTFADSSYSSSSPPPPTTPTNCQCVPYYLCDDTQVVEAIDVRGAGHCGSALDVCCKAPKPTSSVAPTVAPTSPAATASPGFVPQCGTLHPNGVNARILGFKESEAQFGEYPWMAALLESRAVGGKWVLQFLCGASLVTPRVLLTAAHCLKGKKSGSLVVRVGEWDTQSTNEFYPHQDLRVAEVVVHPEYYGGGLYNDVGVVFLRGSAVLAPHIDTVCLPSGGYDNSSCWATGWGKSAFGPAGSYQAILREVNLGVTPPLVCQGALRRTSLGAKFSLHPSFLCAGGLKNLDTCVGDGGGPLVCPSLLDPWRYVLVGIVSWGVNCGNYGVPGVYVDVPRMRPWIETEIRKRYPGWSSARWTIEGSLTTKAGGGGQGG